MSLSFVAVTLGAIGIAFATTGRSHNGAGAELRAQFLGGHHAELPSAQDILLTKSGVEESTSIGLLASYSETGWVTLSHYAPGSCDDLKFAEGIPVDTCFLIDGVGYKYQLKSDNCNGVILQRYKDKACTKLLIGVPTAVPDCENIGDYNVKLTCTTNPQPKLSSQMIINMYYRDENCGELGSFLGIPPGSCQQDNAKFTCSGAKAQMELYSRSSCGGIKLGTTTIPSLCTPYKDVGSDDLIDDAFYAPGKAAESVTVSCMEAHVENSDPGNNGSSGGGAASFLRQLDARAVAGVVAGSILALLAL